MRDDNSQQQFEQDQQQEFEMTANVYAKIAAVAADMAHEGVAKDRRNTTQNYQFRGIDDMYNALAPVLAKHKLVILPRCLSRESSEKATAKGGVLFYVVVEAEFDIVSADDGSKHTIKTFGEAMDSADKATNKAMSAAYKYAVMQAFCIPTEGDNDADASTPEVVAQRPIGKVDVVVKDQHLAAINGAATTDALFATFSAAYRVAQAVNDKDALTEFTKAKDARKVALVPATDEYVPE